jgi:hypothetical protein
MNENIYNINEPLKVISSLVYRLIIVVVSVIIIYNVKQSLLYYILPILYFIIYITIIKKQKAQYRLIYDYIFITIILIYSGDRNDIVSIILFLLPFINSPNHTGDKKNILYLVIVSFVSLNIVYLYNDFDQYNIYVILKIGFILLLLAIILVLEYGRSIFNDKILDGYRLIDNLEFEKSRASNIPRIYNNLITILNENILRIFFINTKIKYISSFQIKNEKIYINNSSKFFSHIETEQKNIIEILTLSKQGKDISNIKFLLNNNVLEDKIILIYIPYKKHFIYFILFFERDFNKPNLILRIMINNYLKPLFKKVIQTIKFEEYMKVIQLQNQEKLLSDMKYVSTTNKSLHTINNEFTPIKNYFKMLDEYENFTKEKQQELGKKIKKNEDMARISFNRVLKLSEFILDKNLNPFSVKCNKTHKVRFLYMKLKALWNIKVEYDSINLIVNSELLDKIKFKSDIDLVEILFLDIIANITKNSKKISKVDFDINDDVVIISFINDTKLSPKDRDTLTKNIRLFNDGDRTELLLKKGHGFANIKEIVTNLNIGCKIDLQGDIFKVELYIPILKEEGSNEHISS